MSKPKVKDIIKAQATNIKKKLSFNFRRMAKIGNEMELLYLKQDVYTPEWFDKPKVAIESDERLDTRFLKEYANNNNLKFKMYDYTEEEGILRNFHYILTPKRKL